MAADICSTGEATRPPPIDVTAAAVFLDVDGTLAPLEAQPTGVRATPRRTSVLKSVNRALRGRVAAISGRCIQDVDRILGGSMVAVAGLHGLERRGADRKVHYVKPDPAIPYVADWARDLVRDNPGLLFENKHASVAVHYRMRPDLEAQLIAAVRAVGLETGLQFRPGSMVVELRTPGPHKGDALLAFMTEVPFQGAIPIYVGDDLTDEDGFEAAASVGGVGVLVGSDRPTKARYRIPDVEAVLRWLETLVSPSEKTRAVNA